MTVIQGILLGVLQGIAEFLPISSSGHLAVCQKLFGLKDVPLLFDVMLHLATLLAVCLYFRRTIFKLLCAFVGLFNKKVSTKEEDPEDLLCGNNERSRATIIAIIITTFVTGAIGVVTSKLIDEGKIPLKVTSLGFLITALLLIASNYMEKSRLLKKGVVEAKDKKPINPLQALVIGLMQGFGTLPGISRSGSTIAGSLFSGVDRKASGEYSFIASIPAILGAFILEAKDLSEVSSSIGYAPVVAGMAASFAWGYLSLVFLMKMIRKGKLQWFSAYLIPLGVLGLIFF